MMRIYRFVPYPLLEGYLYLLYLLVRWMDWKGWDGINPSINAVCLLWEENLCLLGVSWHKIQQNSISYACN